MSAISDEPEKIKFVHTYGAGLHSPEAEYDVHDPKWQKRQVDDFVEFARLAEEVGFDGVTITEHHAPQMVCPSPHLLLAAAAVNTSRIRLGTAVTVLPLYHPVRAAEEAGTLDLLSGGRFEIGLGKGAPREVLNAIGTELSPEEAQRGWLEAIELFALALTERDVTYDGEFFKVPRPTTIATQPLQDPLPIWLAGASPSTTKLAAERGWSIMRNFGTNADHREALDLYVETAAAHGYERSGANLMVERFVAIGEDEAQAERNLNRLSTAFGRFIALFSADGRRAVPEKDAEFLVAEGSKDGRPALAMVGTPDQIIDELQQVIDETGARRILIETFSPEETRLFAESVMPVLRERNLSHHATAAASRL